MSVVVAKLNKKTNTIEIVADTQASIGFRYKVNMQKEYGTGKIIKKNGVIVGSVGYTTEIAFMSEFLSTTKPKSNRQDDIISFFIKFREYCLKLDKNYVPYNNWIIAFDGACYQIHSDLDIVKLQDFFVIGSGATSARPILHIGMSAKKAVEVACEIDLYCNRPIDKYSMKTKNLVLVEL